MDCSRLIRDLRNKITDAMGDPGLDPGSGKSAIKDTLATIRESEYGLETR